MALEKDFLEVLRMIVPATLTLPPAQLPALGALEVAPVTLRPMELADSATAFALSELAFLPDDAATPEARQRRWDGGAREWFGWLHTQARGNAYVAARVSDGQVVGYARALRDDRQQTEALTEIFVHPAFQRAQIGKALLRSVLSADVPDRWRRVIFAHPDPVALGLYHRWGTFPVGTAWYVRPQIMPEMQPALLAQLASARAQGYTIRSASLVHDRSAITWLDHAVLGTDRVEQHAFVAARLKARTFIALRWGRIAAYGTRVAGHIGPVVGETPADVLAMVIALFADALAHGETAEGLWIPGANTALLEWLANEGIPMRIAGQATLMASDAGQFTHLDRCVMTSPPYVI
jgi:ribosomal protein S18 acetylase RimI-like enzyme